MNNLDSAQYAINLLVGITWRGSWEHLNLGITKVGWYDIIYACYYNINRIR